MPLPTYRGAPLLDWMPDASAPTDHGKFTQAKNRLQTPAGAVRDDTPHQMRPRTPRRLRFVLDGRDAIADARALIQETIQGRLNGFWVPAWFFEDLVLADDVAHDATTLAVRGWDYTDYYAGTGLGREHLAVFAMASGSAPTLLCRKVTESVKNEDGTETLTIDSALGMPAGIESLVSALLFVRADDDKIGLEWESMSVAVLELPVIDLPFEVP